MSSGTTSATHSPRTSDIGPLVSDDEALKAPPSRNNCNCCSPVSIFRVFDAFANSTSILPADEVTRQLHVNAWSDPSDATIRHREWLPTKEYWGLVEARVVELLQRWNLGS